MIRKLRMIKMAEIKFEITKKVGVIADTPKGWRKELNIVVMNT